MDFEVVILGSDANAYYMARCVHEAYGHKVKVLSNTPMSFVNHSNIIEATYDNRLWDINKFADALNELRYNKKNNEFYLQELNSFYSNSYDINLTDSSIILRTKQSISYFNFDKTINEETQISNTLKSNEFLEDKNKVYYVLDDGIHEYDITTKEERLFLNIGTDENVTFLDKCEDILYFKSNGELFLYNDHFKDTLKLSDYINEGFTFMNGTKNGFLYITEDNKIKEFDAIKKAANDYIYDFGSKIVYSKNIKDNIYFMKDEDNKNYIIDVENKNIIKTLNNDYLYIVKVD